MQEGLVRHLLIVARGSIFIRIDATHRTEVLKFKHRTSDCATLLLLVTKHRSLNILISIGSTMAGLGRRTHYRKHLTDSVLHDLPEPKEDERIAKVVATRGSNQFDIILSSPSTIGENGVKREAQEPQLAILPTKFHKLVWVKRNDFVIVQTAGEQDGDEANEARKTKNGKDEGGIRYMIAHILYKNQIKHLKSKNLWPDGDPEFNNDIVGQENDEIATEDLKEMDDGIVYGEDFYGGDQESGDDEEGNDDDLLFVNTNRVAALTIQDDDESSDSSDD